MIYKIQIGCVTADHTYRQGWTDIHKTFTTLREAISEWNYRVATEKRFYFRILNEEGDSLRSSPGSERVVPAPPRETYQWANHG